MNWETGKRSPSADDITRIASVLEISESDLIHEKSHSDDSHETFSFEFCGHLADEALIS